MPRIVVLDGYTLNPGDLSWESLKALGDCEVHPRTGAGDIVSRAAGAEVLLSNKTPLTAETIGQLPELRYIGVLATGYDVVDLPAATARGIAVTNVPNYSTASVAQHVFALLLELTHRVGHHAQAVRDGRWAGCPDFCFWDFPLVELQGLTLGILGFGAIGQNVARIGRGFGMSVIAHTRTPRESEEVEFVSVEELFRRSDVLSLHCPLTEETRGIVDAARLVLMKPAAFLINTSRGPLVVEQDLADALNEEKIAGAALDVLGVEPPGEANPLYAARNCFITPHLAWATRAARQRLMDIAVENVRAYLAGEPRNVVNSR